MNYWLVQGNPKVWRIHDFLQDHPEMANVGSEWEWTVSRRVDDIGTGDFVALWLSGAPTTRGVYALARVTGEPYEPDADDDRSYWSSLRGRGTQPFMPFTLTHAAFERPILATELRADPRFESASILKMPRAANPHELTKDQWDAIAARI